MSINDHFTRCGLDEVGRGSLAGPLVACGVIVSQNNIEKLISNSPYKIRDSKIMPIAQRLAVSEYLTANVIYHLEEISVEEINKIGIGPANTQIFERITLKLTADEYLVDGNLKFDSIKIKSLIDADAQIPEVMMASIIAKVYRDRLMEKLHYQYPHFDWLNNKGYGTKNHMDALKSFPPSPHHRLKFID